jgi:hypothetical protein
MIQNRLKASTDFDCNRSRTEQPSLKKFANITSRPSTPVFLRYSKLAPTWMLLKGIGPSRLTGEFGILKGIRANDLSSTRRCFLYMQHEESSYLGCLLFHDIAFSRQITALLQCYCDHSIAAIGSLDLDHTF